MKKIKGMLLVCAVFLMAGTVDVKESHASHWADQYLYNLAYQNILVGDQSGQINPDTYVTRAEFVTVLNRALGYTEVGDGAAFEDVDENAWYYDEFSIASNQGYFQGSGEGLAYPEGNIFREEAVTLICRALKIEPTSEITVNFRDIWDFSNWSRGYINASVERGFVSGYVDGTFKPENLMLKGELAKVISEVTGEIINSEGEHYIGYASNNVTIISAGVTLSDTMIPGDLYITAGTGLGEIILENVTIGGQLIISGTGNAERGETGITLDDCDINEILIDTDREIPVSIRADGYTNISNTIIRSNAFLEEDRSGSSSAFENVSLEGLEAIEAVLSGDFEDVIVKEPSNELSLEKGSIDNLMLDEVADTCDVFLQEDTYVDVIFFDTESSVTGEGEIGEAIINAENCTIEMLPDYIYIRPGVEASVNGAMMDNIDAEIDSLSPRLLTAEDDNVYATSAELLIETNKPGKVYVAVSSRGNLDDEDVKEPPEIDADEFLEVQEVSVTTEKEVVAEVSGLTDGMRYYYYILFEDTRGDTDWEEGYFTTDDETPPTLATTSTIATVSSFNVTYTVSEDAKLYWAVYENGYLAPEKEDIASGNPQGALGKGTQSAYEGRNNVVTVTGNLAANTSYDIYLVAEDYSGNISDRANVFETSATASAATTAAAAQVSETGLSQMVKVNAVTTNDAGDIVMPVANTPNITFRTENDDAGSTQTSQGESSIPEKDEDEESGGEKPKTVEISNIENSSVVGPTGVNNSYSGTVTVTFNQGIYRKSNDSAQALNSAAISAGMNPSGMESLGVIGIDASDKLPIESFVIKYTSANEGEKLTLQSDIYNSTGLEEWNAGTLTMTFTEDLNGDGTKGDAGFKATLK